MSSQPAATSLLVLLLVLAPACGLHLRTCDQGCGEDGLCDVRFNVCVVKGAETADGGEPTRPDAGGSADAGAPAGCTPGKTQRCTGGCFNLQTCSAAGAWGPCVSGCVAGLECKDDACRCTPSSCAGCCVGNQSCHPGQAYDFCGSGGVACQDCGAQTTGTPSCTTVGATTACTH